MDIVVIVLRLAHIFAGVFWAGTSLLFMAVIVPVARSMGPDGMRFFGRITSSERYLKVIAAAAGITVLAGLLLYLRHTGANPGAFMSSGFGAVITIGSVAGIAAFVVGIAVLAPTSRRAGALMHELEAAGGPPTPAQRELMQALQKRSALGSLILTLLLVVSVAAMAIARYV